jgi:polysaccharide biosynthesis PFTS motif protein
MHFVFNLINKIKARALKRVIRGYHALKKSNQLDRISVLKQDLTDQPLRLYKLSSSSRFMGAGYPEMEVIVRQYLLLRIGGISLNKALLFALGKRGGKVIFPLPKDWQITIAKHGFDVANYRSSLLWQLYVFGAFLYGIFQIAKIISSGLASRIREPLQQKKHIYFANLSANNLPQIASGKKSYDIFSWYLQWSGRIQNIEAVFHSVPNISNRFINDVELISQAGVLPHLVGLRSIFNYVTWGLRESFLAFFDYIRGRWLHAFILNQAALSAKLRLLPKSSLASEYLFHNSTWIFRPLWTYDAEQIGSKVTFYFYSCNTENFKVSDSKAPLIYGYNSMNWSHYLVWDKFQADFIRRAVGSKPRIDIVGPIWFNPGSYKDNNSLPKKSILVFDVQPFRSSSYCSLGARFEYYVPSIANHFLSDIHECVKGRNLKVAFKQKRDIGKLSHPSYRHTLQKLQLLPNFFLIDHDISAFELIQNSAAVISMPYTSTALIARALGKVSVYYDPSELLRKDDIAAHGIPVLAGKYELEQWIARIESDLMVKSEVRKDYEDISPSK